MIKLYLSEKEKPVCISWMKSQQIFLLAHRSHSGVTLVPNLFGKPTILVVGGGSLNGALDEVVSGTPYIESAQVSLSLYDSHVLLVFAILCNRKNWCHCLRNIFVL